MSNIKSAMTILPEIRKGAVVSELSRALHDATEAAMEFGKPATVTLTIVIGTDKDKRRLTQPPLYVTAEVDTKLPKAPLEATVFFPDQDQNLTRNLAESREPELALSSVGVVDGDGVIHRSQG